eukprot:COSAG05_NODE_21850_length_269_cov_0.523529_1_plen_52_part_00
MVGGGGVGAGDRRGENAEVAEGRGTREGRTTVVVNYASGNLASGIQTTYLP